MNLRTGNDAYRNVRRVLLWMLVAVHVAAAGVYMFTVPLYESSDEFRHYPLVRHLADNGLQLPSQDPETVGPWKQQGNQPPLYHLAAAVLTSWIDTSDYNEVYRLNPLQQPGEIHPDGNANLVLHSGSPPKDGTYLATMMARGLSLVFGALTVLVTYQTAREVVPEYPAAAFGAAGFVAFLPMFLFVSASVKNDALANLLGNLLLLLLIRLLKAESLPNWRTYAILGAATGAGILSKLSIGFMMPLVALTLLILSLRFRTPRPLVLGGIVSGALTTLIAGWWYWRNYQLFGDPTGLNRFLDIVGRRVVPADLERILMESGSFLRAFWGIFGSVNVPMPEIIYMLLNLLGGFALVSAATYLLYRVLLPRVRHEWSLTRWLVVTLSLLWPLVSLLSYMRWTAITPASQGRLVFGALSAIAVWLVIGLIWFLPQRIRYVVVGVGVMAFAIHAFIVPFRDITPVYALPEQINPGEPAAVFSPPDENGQIAVSDLSMETATARPGEYVHMSVDLAVQAPFVRNWALFVHLLSPQGVIVAQRDVYPGRGLMAMSDLEAGRAWENSLAVHLPESTYTPQTLDVRMGWYHVETGTRMTLSEGSERLNLGTVDVPEVVNDEGIPNPLDVNFGDRAALVGYEVSDLGPAPGQPVTVTLYWERLQAMQQDYTVFANIIDPDTLTKYAASNQMPADYNRPTSSWGAGEMIVDQHVLEVAPDAVPGIYQLEVGLYVQDEDGTFQRLRVRGTSDDKTYLTRVRIQ